MRNLVWWSLCRPCLFVSFLCCLFQFNAFAYNELDGDVFGDGSGEEAYRYESSGTASGNVSDKELERNFSSRAKAREDIAHKQKVAKSTKTEKISKEEAVRMFSRADTSGDVFIGNERVVEYNPAEETPDQRPSGPRREPYDSQVDRLIESFVPATESVKYKKANDLNANLFERYSSSFPEGYDDFSEIGEYEEIDFESLDHRAEVDNMLKDKIGVNKKISLDISEDVHVKDVILEVSRIASVNVQINPLVDGYVILSVKNKTVYEVFQRIAEVADLNIIMEGDVVRFEPDLPKTVSYTVGLLDMQRKSSTVYSFSTSVEAQGVGGANDSISSTNESSLWSALESGLKNILDDYPDSRYVINTQAGVVTVVATDRVQRVVSKYIKKVVRFATTQILIDLRLVEVQLSDENKTGVNFSYTGTNFSVGETFNRSANSAISLTGSSDEFAYKYNGSNLQAAITAVSAFGNTKTISSPKLSVMNNQQSFVSFATSYVFFRLTPKLQNQFVGSNGNNTVPANPTVPIIVDSEMKTVPIGVILSVQAVADPDTKEILMSIRPSISSVSSTVEDPAAAYLTNTLGATNTTANSTTVIANKIPVVKKREMDAVLRLKSGEIMVIGGFTSDHVEERRVGIPILKDIPLFGLLFGKREQVNQTVETLIFVKASVVPPNEPLTDQDRDFYEAFAHVGVSNRNQGRKSAPASTRGRVRSE